MTASPPDSAPAAEAPAPRKAGAPPTVPNAERWSFFTDGKVKAEAIAKAKAEGTDLSSVMRSLMAKYAAGRVKA